MRKITMQQFREQPGEFIRDVQRNGLSFLLTKQGKPAALLVPPDGRPLDDVTTIGTDGSIHGPRPLTEGHDLGGNY
jgi:prevent-host-death family protein